MPRLTQVLLSRCSLRQARRIHADIALILTTGLLAAVALSVPAPMGVQIVFLSLSVLILGIPHGAMDHRVGEWVLKDYYKDRWAWLFGVGYCTLAVAALLVWHLAPVAALMIFLVLSAFHFGLGDAEQPSRKISPSYRTLIGLTRGAIPIGLPVIFHRSEVTQLFGWLMPQAGASLMYTMPVIFWAAVFITVPAFLLQMSLALWKKAWSTVGELAVLALVGAMLPPLLSFAIYFGLWHAPRHLIELASWSEQQFGSHLRPDEVSLVSGCRRIAVEAIPLTLITWVIMGTSLLILIRSMSVESSTVRVIFISLSALTVPHMILTAAAQQKPTHTAGLLRRAPSQPVLR